jgi:BioD-like phosphotransacetylase family protein
MGRASAPALELTKTQNAGTIVTCAPQVDAAAIAGRAGVICVLPEDSVLAAPSVEQIAAALQARWVARPDVLPSVARVMIGTIASDAAAPYFGARRRTCVVTRYDKTDVQLAALQTDTDALVLTGGGEPSPYLVDRVANSGGETAVLLAQPGTVETVRAIEGLFGQARFDGAGKLDRAVALLDEAGATVSF